MSQSDIDYAIDIQDKLANGGYTLVNKVAQVYLPAKGTTGNPVVELKDC